MIAWNAASSTNFYSCMFSMLLFSPRKKASSPQRNLISSASDFLLSVLLATVAVIVVGTQVRHDIVVDSF